MGDVLVSPFDPVYDLFAKIATYSSLLTGLRSVKADRKVLKQYLVLLSI